MSASPADESGLLPGVRSGDELALLAWAEAWEERGWDVAPLRQLPPLLAAIREARAAYEKAVADYEDLSDVQRRPPLCLHTEGWSWGWFLPCRSPDDLRALSTAWGGRHGRLRRVAPAPLGPLLARPPRQQA
jgi:hypothetical protein